MSSVVEAKGQAARPVDAASYRQGSDMLRDLPEVDQAAGASTEPTRYAWYVACTLMLVAVISFLDRKALVMLGEPIKRELQLSDAQLGLLTGGLFTLVYALTSFPFAWLADRFSRAKIIGGCLVAWSVLTAAGGLANGFATLAASRIGVAAGEAGANPAAYALVTNYFPASARGRAYSLLFAGAPVGILLGILLGGILGEEFGWRAALAMMGLPGVAVGILVLLTIRDRHETADHGAARHREDQARFVPTLMLFARDPILRNITAAAAFLFVYLGSTLSLFAPYMMREYEISAGSIGLNYGLALGLGGFAGALLGGWFTDRMSATRRDLPLMIFAGILILVLALAISRLLLVNFNLVIALVAIETLLTSTYAAPTLTQMQARVSDQQRSMATAILFFAINGIGGSIGPLLAGAISDHVASGGAATADTLRVGLLATTPFLVGACILYLRTAAHVRAEFKARRLAPVGHSSGEAIKH